MKQTGAFIIAISVVGLISLHFGFYRWWTSFVLLAVWWLFLFVRYYVRNHNA